MIEYNKSLAAIDLVKIRKEEIFLTRSTMILIVHKLLLSNPSHT